MKMTCICKAFRYKTSFSPAVNCNGSVLTELVLCFLYMSDEFYEAFTRAGDSLFRPVSELELSNGS